MASRANKRLWTISPSEHSPGSVYTARHLYIVAIMDSSLTQPDIVIWHPYHPLFRAFYSHLPVPAAGLRIPPSPLHPSIWSASPATPPYVDMRHLLIGQVRVDPTARLAGGQILAALEEISVVVSRCMGWSVSKLTRDIIREHTAWEAREVALAESRANFERISGGNAHWRYYARRD